MTRSTAGIARNKKEALSVLTDLLPPQRVRDKAAYVVLRTTLSHPEGNSNLESFDVPNGPMASDSFLSRRR